MLDSLAANPLLAGLVVFAALLALWIILWVARPYVREVLVGLAGAPSRVARGAALRLRAEARRIDARYRARVQEHLRQDLEERLSRQARQLEGRVQADLNRADATLMKLRDTADSVIRAADDADPTRIADRIIAEVKEGEGLRNGALAKAHSRLEAAARGARGQARNLKPEARMIIGATDKLRLIEHKLSRHAHDMNDSAEKYERLLTSDERMRGAGDASIVVPWFAALVVIAIAAAGAVLNFQLLERPMAELVGGGARIGGVSLAALAAITLILLEAAAGIVLMEAAGATQLLPVFRRMSGRMTVGFAVAALFFLAVFSAVEVALAFTREAIIALDADVLRAAAGESTEAAATSSLPVALIAQALLGFAIPWILAVVAIPAETVINNTRFIVEVLWKQTLAFTAFLLAALGTLLRAGSQGLMAIYDLAIFPALATDRLLRPRRRAEPEEESDPRPIVRRHPPATERPERRPDLRAVPTPATATTVAETEDDLLLEDQRAYANGSART